MKINANVIKCEIARRDFWEYCKLMASDFYKEERLFLKQKCKQYQEFYENSNEHFLIDNEPPRHGKSRTATLFVQWIIGKYPKDKIITGSYNETLSTVFSKGVRNKIQEKSVDGRIVYSDIFHIRVKRGDGAANLWGIEGNDTNTYLATSPTGTATGFGADLILIDDIIKNEYEARNDNVKEQHYKWFTDTMLSRREGKRKVLVVMTRWASDDLAGRIIETLNRQNQKYRLISLKAFDGQKMLCDDILNYQQYSEILDGDTGRDIIEANYNQSPIDMEGRLYTELKTYDSLPKNIECIESYTDTADEGADYLCCIIYAVKDCAAYVLEVIYTQDGMDITENIVAKAFADYEVNKARIESNNGGRGFARNVTRLTKEKYNNTLTRIIPFTQSKNKNSRILTGSTGVMNNVYFPVGWENRWREYWRDMVRYQRIGKNAHDDAQDCTTGVYENLPKRKRNETDSYSMFL